MPRYELRLTLPDHPGAFGVVADALARLGANIVSFEAVDVEHDVAVDRLELDLDAQVVGQVATSLEGLDGVDVEAFRPVPRRPLFAGPLELVDSLVQRPPAEVLQALADGVPATMRVDWGVVLARREPQPRRLAASVGSPSLVGMGTPWLPLSSARALEVDPAWVPSRWGLVDDRTAVAVTPLEATGEVVLLVVRRHGPTFRRRELQVLGALARVAGRLAGDDPREAAAAGTPTSPEG